MEAQPWTSKDVQDATNFCVWQCDATLGFASRTSKCGTLDEVSIFFWYHFTEVDKKTPPQMDSKTTPVQKQQQV